jgi:hypothetical protein
MRIKPLKLNYGLSAINKNITSILKFHFQSFFSNSKP